MLERTDAITNEVLQPITFVLAYPTVYGLYRRFTTARNAQRKFLTGRRQSLFRNCRLLNDDV